MYATILRNISKYVDLTDEEQTLFVSLLSVSSVPRKTILLREGDLCQFEGYIQKGCIRVYCVNEKGCEVTLSFAVEDWWVCDIDSFYSRSPSNFYIETLEQTDMFYFTPETKEKLLVEIPKFERVFRLMVQRNLTSIQNRLVKAISIPATDRYLDFLKVYPSVPLRVPQYFIASYLGVSPEFVSTIRKRLLSKQVG